MRFPCEFHSSLIFLYGKSDRTVPNSHRTLFLKSQCKSSAYIWTPLTGIHSVSLAMRIHTVKSHHQMHKCEPELRLLLITEHQHYECLSVTKRQHKDFLPTIALCWNFYIVLTPALYMHCCTVHSLVVMYMLWYTINSHEHCTVYTVVYIALSWLLHFIHLLYVIYCWHLQYI